MSGGADDVEVSICAKHACISVWRTDGLVWLRRPRAGARRAGRWPGGVEGRRSALGLGVRHGVGKGLVGPAHVPPLVVGLLYMSTYISRAQHPSRRRILCAELIKARAPINHVHLHLTVQLKRCVSSRREGSRSTALTARLFKRVSGERQRDKGYRSGYISTRRGARHFLLYTPHRSVEPAPGS